MATIGTFTKTENGFTGTIKTLSLNVKTVKFVPAEGDSERGPDFRIFAGATDFGAAWKKTARETQREYLSVKLDDPSFPAPISCFAETASCTSRTPRRGGRSTTSGAAAPPGFSRRPSRTGATTRTSRRAIGARSTSNSRHTAFRPRRRSSTSVAMK